MVVRDRYGCDGAATAGRTPLTRWSEVLVAAAIGCAGLVALTSVSSVSAATPTSAAAARATATTLATAPSRALPVDPPMIGAAGTAPRVAGVAHAAMRSLNWGGYGVTGGRGAFTSAQTTFVVPGLTSCGPTENSASSFWAGIDGFSSNTVEQDGVDAYCSNGTKLYFAWYELYPQVPVMLPRVIVHSGDTVVASVNFLGGSTYRLQVADSTTSTSATVSVSLPGATNSSAECIAEDPGTTPVPYASYGSVSFSSCTANGVPIGQLSPTSLTTVSAQGATLAVPSGLVQNTAFSVTRPAPVSAPVSPPAPTRISSPSPLTAPVVGMASTPSGNGYWLANATGGVSAHGGAVSYGSMSGATLNSPITHIVATGDGLGYWLVAGDGGTFAFGDARFHGSMGGRHLNAPVVDMAPTPDDGGYWLVASDGGIFAFGDARFHGSMGGRRLNKPVVAITADPQTGGYWLVATDGGVFAFNAPFYGSTGGITLNKPIVAMAGAASGSGYWFVAGDGGVFAFHAPFRGSGGGQSIPAPVVGIAPDPATNGYWMVGRDGSVYSFGAPSYGSG